MRISIISPYHGGSHQAWAEGYQRHSQHEVALLTLPARFWKWRMHGGAVTLARQFLDKGSQADLILATDMTDLTTFLALTGQTHGRIPTFLYMHENQLTYPLPDDGRSGPMRRQKGERDLHYAFINYASMTVADQVFFNSNYHKDSFFVALPKFLKHFPDYNELETISEIEAKSRALPVGIDLARLGPPLARLDPPLVKNSGLAAPPLIVWNQRWEYDKNPAAFFQALYQMVDEGIPFRLALCGENFRRRPSEFETAMKRLAGQMIHVGYANQALYRELLWQAEVTISTAVHEFFGVSILEAIYCHTFPILPHRLSYPELIPAPYHYRCLYENSVGLAQRLRWALTHREEAAVISRELAGAAAVYDWSHMAPQYDQICQAVREM